MTKKVLAIVAHPDDAEFLCTGTLALLHNKRWEVHITTMTAGDCGSKVLGNKEISEIRMKEAVTAAGMLDADYTCLGFEDVFITYDKLSIIKTITHIRKIQPHLVITMSPSCYMVDHEMTSKLVQTACFAGGLVNIHTPGYSPIDYIPHLYYTDPLEGKDKYGHKITATTVVDISSVMNTKIKMLECHKSQRDWLKQHHGMDEYVISMKRQAESIGKGIGVAYAEGFRQHLGHAYPQDNLILQILEETREIKENNT